MRCDTQVTATFNKVAGIVAFVCPDGAATLGVTQPQLQRFRAFGGTVGLGQRDVPDEAVAVLGQGVGHVAQAAGIARAFAGQFGFRISFGLVGFVVARLITEIDIWITP